MASGNIVLKKQHVISFAVVFRLLVFCYSAVSVFKRLQLLSKLSKSLVINLGRFSFLPQYARTWIREKKSKN